MRRYFLIGGLMAALIPGIARAETVMISGTVAVDTMIRATDAWVRLPPLPGRPAALYFTLKGGAKDDVLLDVTTPLARRTELHVTESVDGHLTMRRVDQLPLAARQTLILAPRETHVMLYELDAGLKPGDTVPLTLTFASGVRLPFKAQARAINSTVPGAALMPKP